MAWTLFDIRAMNERQRDRFLFEWSRRRTKGKRGAARQGMIAGAVAGVVVAGLLGAPVGWSAGTAGVPPRNAYDLVLSGMPLTVVSVPLFASIGRAIAARRWLQCERRYRLLLIDAGVSVPRTRPPLRLADRAPLFAVWGAIAFVAGMIAVVRWLFR